MSAIATNMSHGHGGMTLTRCQRKKPINRKSGNGRLWKSEVMVKCACVSFFFFAYLSCVVLLVLSPLQKQRWRWEIGRGQSVLYVCVLKAFPMTYALAQENPVDPTELQES